MNSEPVISLSREELKDSSRLALDAANEILGWAGYLLENTHNGFEDACSERHPKPRYYTRMSEKGLTQTSLPQFVAWLAMESKEIDAGGALPQIVFVMAAFRKGREWNLQVAYGRINNARRRATKFQTDVLAREILTFINNERKGKSSFASSHVEADCEVEWRDYFDYDSRLKIGKLGEEVNERFIAWLDEAGNR
jgi:hypothetical protein